MTIPYLVMLVALKYSFNYLSMVQIMEFIFVLSTASLITILPFIQFYKKEYIFDLTNKKEALSAASWLATFIFFDFFLLKALPLVSKCVIMTYLLTEIDIKERPSSFFGSLKLKQGVSQRLSTFVLKTLILLGLLAFDIVYLDLHSRDTSTIVRYYLTLLLLVVNTLYVYTYMVKRTLVEAYVDRATELLKVKWLANLMLAFYVPLLVFVANTTPNYRILRFNQDLSTIILVAVGILLHFYLSTFSPHP